MEEERALLNGLDDQIARLFYRRMEIVERVAHLKFALRSPVYHPQREKQVTDRLLSQNGEKYREELLALYAVIFEQSRARQEKIIRELERQV